MHLMDLNLDVLTMIISGLDQKTLLHITRTCKLARGVGIRALVADVQIELHHVSSFVAFMLAPANHTRLPPLLRHLAVKEDHFDVALASLERDSSDPAKEHDMLYTIAAQSLAHLFGYTAGLRTLDIVDMETLLEKSGTVLLEALGGLPSLRRTHLYSPGAHCAELMFELNTITQVVIDIDPMSESNRESLDLHYLIPVAHRLTTLSLRDNWLDPDLGFDVTFTNVTNLRFEDFTVALDLFLPSFPNVQKLSLENSPRAGQMLLSTGEDDIHPMKHPMKHIDSVSTDWDNLKIVSPLCNTRHLSLTYSPDLRKIAMRVRYDFEAMKPCVLLLALPSRLPSPKNLPRLGQLLPDTLRCLEFTLADVDLMCYERGDGPFFHSFISSAPLKYLHISLTRLAPPNQRNLSYRATPSVLRPMLDGVFVQRLAQNNPFLQYVTLHWVHEGWDLMSWRICKGEGKMVTVERMGTFEGQAMKTASFALSKADRD